MNICIIGPKDSRESLEIKVAAEERGHVCKRVYMSDIFFEVKDSKFLAQHRNLDLMEFDVFIFRSINKTLNQALLLANFLHNAGKKVIDQSLAKGTYNPLSTQYELAQQGIAQLDEYITNGLKSARDVLMEMDHPIIVRYFDDKGKSQIATSDDWTESYDLVRTNKNKKFFFGQHDDARSYARVFVIDSQAIGALKRTIMDEEPKLQYSSKFKSIKVEVSLEVAQLAITACQALNIQIGSVDILAKDNKNFVLEVNRAPKFLNFNKITKINFAEKILDYLERA